MDDEHKECTDSFNRVLDKPTRKHLKNLYDTLKEHFQHEEDLMKEYFGSAAAASSFSSLHSHKMDHERILNIVEDELDRVSCSSDT